jgi:hypothetical protein
MEALGVDFLNIVIIAITIIVVSVPEVRERASLFLVLAAVVFRDD